MSNLTKMDFKLEVLRNTLKANNLQRHYLYRIWKIPKILERHLRKARKDIVKDLLTEFDISKDIFNQTWLSNISIEFLIDYTRKLALKHNYETLWRYYEKIRTIRYRKPTRIKRQTVEQIRETLENPCNFVDCVNEIKYSNKVLTNVYCPTCIATKFDKNYFPKILTAWKEKVDQKGKEVAVRLGKELLVKSFSEVKLEIDLRKPANRRYGKFGHYQIGSKIKEIRLYLQKFNTETEILLTYLHELCHHYTPKTNHGEEFHVFHEQLMEALNFEPTDYKVDKRNGKINWTYVMDLKINKHRYKVTLCPVCKEELFKYSSRSSFYQKYSEAFKTEQRYCEECKEWREIE